MDYATFKTYLRTFLWKQNDTDLANNLDSLIVMANAELSRKLDLKQREESLTIAPTDQDFVLPSNFRQMISLTGLQSPMRGTMSNTTATDIYSKRATGHSDRGALLYHVAQDGANKVLRLVGPFSVSNPGSFGLVFRASIPDFAVTDTSWLADNYLDLYVYTVLSHTAPFLREDERIPVWMEAKADAIGSAIMEDKHHVDFGGSPLQMRPHRQVP